MRVSGGSRRRIAFSCFVRLSSASVTSCTAIRVFAFSIAAKASASLQPFSMVFASRARIFFEHIVAFYRHVSPITLDPAVFVIGTIGIELLSCNRYLMPALPYELALRFGTGFWIVLERFPNIFNGRVLDTIIDFIDLFP